MRNRLPGGGTPSPLPRQRDAPPDGGPHRRRQSDGMPLWSWGRIRAPADLGTPGVGGPSWISSCRRPIWSEPPSAPPWRACRRRWGSWRARRRGRLRWVCWIWWGGEGETVAGNLKIQEKTKVQTLGYKGGKQKQKNHVSVGSMVPCANIPILDSSD